MKFLKAYINDSNNEMYKFWKLHRDKYDDRYLATASTIYLAEMWNFKQEFGH